MSSGRKGFAGALPTHSLEPLGCSNGLYELFQKFMAPTSRPAVLKSCTPAGMPFAIE